MIINRQSAGSITGLFLGLESFCTEQSEMATTHAVRSMNFAVGDELLSLQIPHHTTEVADWQLEDSIDLRQAVFNAFDQPVEFPELALAIVDGDSVAIPLEPGVPQAEQLLEFVVEYLVQHGVPASRITVLVSHDHEKIVDSLAARLSQSAKGNVSVRYHRGDDAETMGYLAAAASGAEAIYVDRALLEADVVLPITVARDTDAWAHAGLYGIVPWFTDSKTQSRWKHDCSTDCHAKKEKRLRAATEVAWLLGIQPVLAVLPGPQGNIDSLFFGKVDSVEQSIADAVSPRSLPPIKDRYDLVVVSIDGDQDQQSWENVARVLFMAENYVSEDGKIAVATNLETKPGPPFRWLAGIEENDSIEQHLLKSHHPQSLAAIEILRSRSKHVVYLLSKLPREVVEELGISAMGETEELEHVIASSESCLIISGAQHRWLPKVAAK